MLGPYAQVLAKAADTKQDKSGDFGKLISVADHLTDAAMIPTIAIAPLAAVAGAFALMMGGGGRQGSGGVKLIGGAIGAVVVVAGAKGLATRGAGVPVLRNPTARRATGPGGSACARSGAARGGAGSPRRLGAAAHLRHGVRLLVLCRARLAGDGLGVAVGRRHHQQGDRQDLPEVLRRQPRRPQRDVLRRGWSTPPTSRARPTATSTASSRPSAQSRRASASRWSASSSRSRLLQYWLSGIADLSGDGSELLQGLTRGIGVALLITAWPCIFENAIAVSNQVTAVLVNGKDLDTIAALIAGRLALAARRAPRSGWPDLRDHPRPVATAWVLLALIAMKIVDRRGAGDPVHGACRWPSCSRRSTRRRGSPRLAIRSFVGVLLVPVIWALCLGDVHRDRRRRADLRRRRHVRGQAGQAAHRAGADVPDVLAAADADADRVARVDHAQRRRRRRAVVDLPHGRAVRLPVPQPAHALELAASRRRQLRRPPGGGQDHRPWPDGSRRRSDADAPAAGRSGRRRTGGGGSRVSARTPALERPAGRPRRDDGCPRSPARTSRPVSRPWGRGRPARRRAGGRVQRGGRPSAARDAGSGAASRATPGARSPADRARLADAVGRRVSAGAAAAAVDLRRARHGRAARELLRERAGEPSATDPAAAAHRGRPARPPRVEQMHRRAGPVARPPRSHTPRDAPTG